MADIKMADHKTLGKEEIKKLAKAKADTLLQVFMAFKQPHKSRYGYLIPKDREAWLNFLLHLIRKKTDIKYLSDKELKKVILRAKPNLMKKYPPVVKDRDTPECVYWTEEQVADWIEEIGYPHLKDAFRNNYINGRKLINVDASALNKMGLQDFNQIKDVATQIREVLQVHRPNMLRAIARKVPFTEYLKFHSKTGPSIDGVTFEKFCDTNGYPYDVLRRNKSALIACTVSLHITSVLGILESENNTPEGSETSSENLSLENAPSVEFTVRHQLIRDRAIEKIMEELVARIFDPKYQKRFGADDIFKRILEEAFLELGFSDPELYSEKRVAFAIHVAEALLKEIMNSVVVLNDIKKFEELLKTETNKEDYNPDEMNLIRCIASEFVEEVLPITALLALGEFSLESIFRQQPEFEEFIEDIANEAETKTNELVPAAEEIVNELLKEAQLQVFALDNFPYLSLNKVRSAKSLAGHIIDDLIEESTQEIEVEGEGEGFGEDF